MLFIVYCLKKMIAILSDFQSSEYVGVMKAVIYSVYPQAIITDLFNHVKPQCVKEGAWVLLNNYKYFPRNTIFLCVVDPGVGTKRKAVAIQCKDYYLVGPDNGLLYPTAMDNKIIKVVELPCKNASKTFHGRDVFAIAAAMLESGKPIEELGKKTKLDIKLNFYLSEREGEVVRIDDFGNIITNIPHVNKNTYKVIVREFRMSLDFYNTYEEAPENVLFLIEGSNNTLEISIKNGSAVKKLPLKIGDKIKIY